MNISEIPLRQICQYPIETQSFLLNKKTRPWSEYEDMRLIAGILRYGLESWGTIANFVGNSRTKAQCCQRWTRGLDPRISKVSWTKEEDEKLMCMISKWGSKKWTKIASEMGNRSDVQCRYRFKQLQRKVNDVPLSKSPKALESSPQVTFPSITELLKLPSNMTTLNLMPLPITKSIVNSGSGNHFLI